MAQLRDGNIAPATRAVAITPSNSVDLTDSTRGIYVGASGNVKVDTTGGDTVTFVGMAAGVVHPISARRIYATGTTATSIIGVF